MIIQLGWYFKYTGRGVPSDILRNGQLPPAASIVRRSAANGLTVQGTIPYSASQRVDTPSYGVPFMNSADCFHGLSDSQVRDFVTKGFDVPLDYAIGSDRIAFYVDRVFAWQVGSESHSSDNLLDTLGIFKFKEWYFCRNAAVNAICRHAGVGELLSSRDPLGLLRSCASITQGIIIVRSGGVSLPIAFTAITDLKSGETVAAYVNHRGTGAPNPLGLSAGSQLDLNVHSGRGSSEYIWPGGRDALLQLSEDISQRWLDVVVSGHGTKLDNQWFSSSPPVYDSRSLYDMAGEVVIATVGMPGFRTDFSLMNSSATGFSYPSAMFTLDASHPTLRPLADIFTEVRLVSGDGGYQANALFFNTGAYTVNTKSNLDRMLALCTGSSLTDGDTERWLSSPSFFT